MGFKPDTNAIGTAAGAKPGFAVACAASVVVHAAVLVGFGLSGAGDDAQDDVDQPPVIQVARGSQPLRVSFSMAKPEVPVENTPEIVEPVFEPETQPEPQPEPEPEAEPVAPSLISPPPNPAAVDALRQAFADSSAEAAMVSSRTHDQLAELKARALALEASRVIEPEPRPEAVVEPVEPRDVSRVGLDAVASTVPESTVSPEAVPAEAAAISPSEPVGADSGIEIVTLPKPKYPLVSRRRGEQGVVVLDVQVLPTGKIGEITVVEGTRHPRLRDAAIKAVRSAVFQPATRKGVAVADIVRVPVRFRLQ